MLELVLERNGKRLFCTPVSSEPIAIGRAPDNAVVLLDPEISRRHCCLEPADGGVLMRDLSANGTLVNGALRREAKLGAGDRLAVGPWIIALEETGDTPEQKTIAAAPTPTRVIACDTAAGTLTTEALDITIELPGQPPLAKRIAASDIIFFMLLFFPRFTEM